jgi:phosphatidylinositol glycan class M
MFVFVRRLHTTLLAAVALRGVLLAWGHWQDMTSAVKYTDIDYLVFSDAAACILRPKSPSCSPAFGPLAQSAFEGHLGDPYARDTYRYTPLLALLMTPNHFVRASFGKFVFALADLIVGILLYKLARLRGSTQGTAAQYVGLVWLLNPIIANISTRGSAEAILGILVVSVLSLAERRRWDSAAIIFGLAVHFKIYPIIYSSSLYAAISAREQSRAWICKAHIRFGVISLGMFMALNVAMYLL